MDYPRQPPPIQSYATTATTASNIQTSNDADFGLILQAVDFGNVGQCEDILEKKPNLINEKGWNGMTPLHHSCLKGRKEITRVLLRHDADPNARTAFDETPLHYACRCGNISTIHVLIKAGGDVNLVDKQGRGCMHFAVMGGSSVLALNYLETQTTLTTRCVTSQGDTLLHMACSHYSSTILDYLLRKNRSDVQRQNNKGVTALHLASLKGNSEMIWKLLRTSTCQLTHIQNNDGQTAYDIAKNETTDRHKRVASALKYHMSQNPKLPPKGPILQWTFLLSFPFLWLSIVFLLCSFFNSHASHFSVFMFILLLLILSRQSHRISHICGWPNPVFLGVFMGAVLHCVIASFMKIYPGIWPCQFTVVFMVTMSIINFYYFYFLVFGDPGWVKPIHLPSINGRPMSVLDIALGRCNELQFCPYTEVIRPERGKYCRLCERLVLNMDHHCLFVNNCIAYNNHRPFVVYILATMILQLSFLLSLYWYLERIYSHVSSSYLGELFHEEAWLFSLALICTAALIWEAFLVYTQIKFIALGDPAYYARPHQKPSMHESLNNLLSFFFGRKKMKDRYLKVESSPLLLS